MKLYRIFLRLLLPAALVFSACACSTTESPIHKVLGNSASAPIFMDCKVVSSTEIMFSFSMPVRVTALNFDPPAELASITEGQEVKVNLAAPLVIGAKLTADILVEDEYRNSLNVLVPFSARNDRVPSILINELRTEHGKTKTENRVEFVEFTTQSGGNLAALRLFFAGHSIDEPVYEFPPIEVDSGEYIVLHLRTTETGWADELDADLTLSGGTDALESARDLWIDGNDKLLHKTDAVYLVDQDEKIIDAVLLSENPDPWWKKQQLADAAGLLAKNNAWFPPEGEPDEGYVPGPADAVPTKSVGTAATRSISRDESGNERGRRQNWYVAATSNATPGRPNSIKRQP